LGIRGGHFGFRGVVRLAALATALTTALTAAFATFTATFTSRRTLLTHFGAVGAQLRAGIAAAFIFAFLAVFAAAIATAFTGRAFGPLTPLGAFATCRAGFAVTQFVATFRTALTATFAASTAFAGRTHFRIG
jgi:hypothetical protein